MTKVCIITKEADGTPVKHQKESDGIPVKDDLILRSIRRVKQMLNISTGNQLVVCGGHIEEARKRRAKFEKSMMTASGIGAIFGIVLLVIAILSEKSIFDILRAIFLLVLLVVVMAALSLYQYFPAVEENKQGKPSAHATSPKKKGRQGRSSNMRRR